MFQLSKLSRGTVMPVALHTPVSGDGTPHGGGFTA
jgi:hypothetical protein